MSSASPLCSPRPSQLRRTTSFRQLFGQPNRVGKLDSQLPAALQDTWPHPSRFVRLLCPWAVVQLVSCHLQRVLLAVDAVVASCGQGHCDGLLLVTPLSTQPPLPSQARGARTVASSHVFVVLWLLCCCAVVVFWLCCVCCCVLLCVVCCCCFC